MNKIEEIKKLASLLNEGAITQEEFNSLKRNILSSENKSMTIKSNKSQVYEQQGEKKITDNITRNTELNSNTISPKASVFIVLIGLIVFFFIFAAILLKGNDVKENPSNSYKKEADSQKCSDMNSYNFGYDIARDQQALIADCNYLYDLAITQRDNINKHCFCKGVEDFQSSH